MPKVRDALVDDDLGVMLIVLIVAPVMTVVPWLILQINVRMATLVVAVMVAEFMVLMAIMVATMFLVLHIDGMWVLFLITRFVMLMTIIVHTMLLMMVMTIASFMGGVTTMLMAVLMALLMVMLFMASLMGRLLVMTVGMALLMAMTVRSLLITLGADRLHHKRVFMLRATLVVLDDDVAAHIAM